MYEQSLCELSVAITTTISYPVSTTNGSTQATNVSILWYYFGIAAIIILAFLTACTGWVLHRLDLLVFCFPCECCKRAYRCLSKQTPERERIRHVFQRAYRDTRNRVNDELIDMA